LHPLIQPLALRRRQRRAEADAGVARALRLVHRAVREAEHLLPAEQVGLLLQEGIAGVADGAGRVRDLSVSEAEHLALDAHADALGERLALGVVAVPPHDEELIAAPADDVVAAA